MATANWTDAIEGISQEFRGAFGNLTATQLNWKPGPDQWSVGQVMEHLILTNEPYFGVLAQMRAGTYRAHPIGKLSFIVNLFGKLILNAVQPQTERKTKTFPVFQPAQSDVPVDILRKFEANQVKLVQEIKNSDGLLGRVVSSPAKAFIVYRLDRAFDIIVAHERRHLLQAKRVMQEMSRTSA
jgi:hypothetical protein